MPNLLRTDYVNTISPDAEPVFPGDEFIERRLRAYVRWNAAMMVHRAQRPGVGVGGHISTYASAASLYEVGFNHFFRGMHTEGGGDQIYFQGHASPGIYARAFLEGRLSERRLDGFRQELSHAGVGGGLPSYPHPRLMPKFWQFPTVSMGLGPLNAIYQARFNRYLQARGIADTAGQRVWAFLGDGEIDEPESLGAIGLAAREDLDNLTFVINCNLQRLDGPVRGNGKIIQELESFFAGAGWNVIKVIWGREWDPLLAADTDGALVHLMNTTLDGDYQTYKAESGAFVREHFFGRDPRTEAMVRQMSDTEIWGLKRGGHDYRKLYAAYLAATQHIGAPTVILAKTVKGWTLGSHFEGRNSTHQMKKLTREDLRAFRDRLYLDIPDSALDETLPPYYRPGEGSDELAYLHERRRALGGYIPSRTVRAAPLVLPGDSAYEVARRGSGRQEVATTMAFVRLLKELMKDPQIGHRFVPIIPDEARTFGLDALFPSKKIYSPHGQHYLSVDRELLLSYQEDAAGVLLHEGITEAGSVASFTAAGSSYATHGQPMIPIYVFYSMFGFQRTGDGLWAAADQMTRGFLLGATAGRTTLNGEGLQHQDGHSLLLASTNPACVAYDAAYAFELAHIVRDGLRRMYGQPRAGEDPSVFYYLTVYNEPIRQPPEPDEVDVAGILAGMHRYSPAPKGDGPVAQVLASGIAVPWALEAQRLLHQEWGVHADVWSVTSWTELRRNALATQEWNRLHHDQPRRIPYLTSRLQDHLGPVVAVSDWMRAVPDQVAPFVPRAWTSLGTDGFGRSDTRAALRRYHHIDPPSIALRVLEQLVDQGDLDRRVLSNATTAYHLADGPPRSQVMTSTSAPGTDRHTVPRKRDALAELTAAGVAIWLDDLSRARLSTGSLAELVSKAHVVGVTTNPTIVQKAIGGGPDYDHQIIDLSILGVHAEEALRMLTVSDVRGACDVLRAVHDASDGVHGRVSIEVDPRLAHQTEQTVAQARELWSLVDRPNLFIKIPATTAGLAAITRCLSLGLSVNATLIFSLRRYAEVLDAYLEGLERARASGHDLTRLASVASFFVSRVDTEIDRRLDVIGTAEAGALRGKAAIANARLAFQMHEEVLRTRRWTRLARHGARPQRPLWASTGVKDPAYPDTRYVTELVTDGVVNTMPEATLAAVAEHAVVHGDTIRGGYRDAATVLNRLAATGLDYDDVVDQLERDGLAAFQESWAAIIHTLDNKLAAVPSRPRRSTP